MSSAAANGEVVEGSSGRKRPSAPSHGLTGKVAAHTYGLPAAVAYASILNELPAATIAHGGGCRMCGTQVWAKFMFASSAIRSIGLPAFTELEINRLHLRAGIRRDRPLSAFTVSSPGMDSGYVCQIIAVLFALNNAYIIPADGPNGSRFLNAVSECGDQRLHGFVSATLPLQGVR
jgi:hypothetical protein